MSNFKFGSITGVIDENMVREFVEETSSCSETVYTDFVLYEHVDNNFSFEYYYAVVVYDVEELAGELEEGMSKYAVELHMVVNPSNLGEEFASSLMDSVCVPCTADLRTLDLVWGDATVVMDSVGVDSEEEVEEAVKGAISSIKTVDGLRGFYLDKAWNLVGTNGWDTIRYAIGDSDALF